MFQLIAALRPKLALIIGLGAGRASGPCLSATNSPWQTWFIWLCSALLLFETAAFLLPSFKILEWSFVLPSLVTLFVAVARLPNVFQRSLKNLLENGYAHGFTTAAVVCLASSLLVLLATQTLITPLYDWDGRSIWFFHAKILFYSDGLSQGGGWSLPEIQWSHVAYPKLVPLLAAAISRTVGFWNENLPKISLVVMQVLLVIGILAAFKSNIQRSTFIFCAVILNFYDLTNGYMDALLGLYASVCLWFAINYSKTHQAADAICFFLALGIVCGLKNEGLYFAFCCLLVGIISMIVAPRHIVSRYKPQSALAVAFAAALCSAPVLCWIFIKKIWGVTGWLDIGSPAFIERAVQRIDHLDLILSRMFLNHKLAPIMLIAAILVCFDYAFSKKINYDIVCIMSVALLYIGGLIVVYLGTPIELTFQINTSVDRIIILPSAVFVLVICAMQSRLRPP